MSEAKLGDAGENALDDPRGEEVERVHIGRIAAEEGDVAPSQRLGQGGDPRRVVVPLVDPAVVGHIERENTAPPDRPRRLAHHGLRIAQMCWHVVRDDGVEAAIFYEWSRAR